MMNITNYTFGNTPALVPTTAALELGDDLGELVLTEELWATLARAVGQDPDDEELVITRLARDWHGHRAGDVVICGLAVEGHKFAVVPFEHVLALAAPQQRQIPNEKTFEAMAAGAAWAEREADALLEPPTGPWRASDLDALSLVESDDEEERRALAYAAHAAAQRRWDELVDAAARDGARGVKLTESEVAEVMRLLGYRWEEPRREDPDGGNDLLALALRRAIGLPLADQGAWIRDHYRPASVIAVRHDGSVYWAGEPGAADGGAFALVRDRWYPIPGGVDAIAADIAAATKREECS